jgi:hypothetical protein
MQKIQYLMVNICLLLIIIACERQVDNKDILSIIAETDSTITSSAVVGINGGTIKFDDKTTLKVFPGSLTKDLNIKITRFKTSSSNYQMEREMIILEPEGTIFSKPSTLTLSYENININTSESLQGFSCNNGIWEELKIISKDENKKELKVEVNHFSILFILKRLDLYLTVDIPGKYLKKGDLIYCLALLDEKDKFSWFPGHAALYLGTDKLDNNNNDGQNLIESSPYEVRFNTLDYFKVATFHLFMGARRYDGSISDDQRRQIANFALNQIGKPYSKVGQDPTSNSFSCVGLTEAAYESTVPQLNIIPKILEIPWSLPYDQYARTKPIDKITIKSGDEISIEVYGVIWDDVEKYIKTIEGIDILNLPNGASWTKSDESWIFKWKPGEGDVNKSFNVTYRVARSISGLSERQSQIINFEVVSKIAANNPPLVPAVISPINGAIEVSTSPTLNWSCTDPDGDALTYDVYFGTTYNPTTVIASNQTVTSVGRTSLSINTLYFWKIVAKDSKGATTSGPIWSFTTSNNLNQNFYSNNFSDDLSDWTQYDGTWQNQNGVLYANYDIGCGSTSCSQADLILKDQFQPGGNWRVSVDFTRSIDPSYPTYSAAAAQLVFWESANKKVVISVGNGGDNWGTTPLESIDIQYGEWNGTWYKQDSKIISLNWLPTNWHKMTVEKTGNVYKVYVNNTYLSQFTDTYINGSGKIGLHTYGPKRYDNFVIEKLAK